MWKLVQRKQNKRTAESQVEEAGIGLSLTAFIGTANLFFTGLVILNLNDLPKIVQLPVVYLVVSAVAFILSSVIYANISGMHRQSALRSSMMRVADWISEYPGVYLFLIAIPLVLLGVTTTMIVQITTAVACYGGLLLYSASPFSLDDRRFGKGTSRGLNTAFLAVFTIGIYILAITDSPYLLPCGITGLAVLLLLSFVGITFRVKK